MLRKRLVNNKCRTSFVPLDREALSSRFSLLSNKAYLLFWMHPTCVLYPQLYRQKRADCTWLYPLDEQRHCGSGRRSHIRIRTFDFISCTWVETKWNMECSSEIKWGIKERYRPARTYIGTTSRYGACGIGCFIPLEKDIIPQAQTLERKH